MEELAEPKIAKIPQHNTFKFIFDDREIVFSSEFDSGNCGRVIQKSWWEYDIYTAPDKSSESEAEGYSKSWFYFKINKPQIYKPCFRIGTGEWQRLKTDVQLNMIEQKLVLSYYYIFDQDSECLNGEGEVAFAFSYPYPYERSVELVNELNSKYHDDEEIYFRREVITYSPELRPVHLLTISSQDDKTERREEYMSDVLFPERAYEERPWRFKDNKPIVLLTARVHPGETPASYALEGIINFLLSKTDARALLLRKFFVFLILPVLNPDGVYNGHYRMDTFNQNLNRFYRLATNLKQPSIYAVRHIVEYLSVEQRLCFYMDLHAHAGNKGHFVYGNACDDFVMQVENQVFAKLMQINCKNFEYAYCNFSKRHMKARDRFEELTKEGSGRVTVYKQANLIHSYTLECGFHQATQIPELADAINSDLVVLERYRLEYDMYDDNAHEIYRDPANPPFFTPDNYRNVGKNALVSILDIFEKNPYSRIPNTPYKTIESVRKETAFECARIDRFRLDPQAYKKVRRFSEYIGESFFSYFEKRRVFRFDKEFASFKWPQNLTTFLTKYIFIEQTTAEAQKRKKKWLYRTALQNTHAAGVQEQSPVLQQTAQQTGDSQTLAIKRQTNYSVHAESETVEQVAQQGSTSPSQQRERVTQQVESQRNSQQSQNVFQQLLLQKQIQMTAHPPAKVPAVSQQLAPMSAQHHAPPTTSITSIFQNTLAQPPATVPAQSPLLVQNSGIPLLEFQEPKTRTSNLRNYTFRERDKGSLHSYPTTSNTLVFDDQKQFVSHLDRVRPLNFTLKIQMGNSGCGIIGGTQSEELEFSSPEKLPPQSSSHVAVTAVRGFHQATYVRRSREEFQQDTTEANLQKRSMMRGGSSNQNNNSKQLRAQNSIGSNNNLDREDSQNSERRRREVQQDVFTQHNQNHSHHHRKGRKSEIRSTRHSKPLLLMQQHSSSSSTAAATAGSVSNALTGIQNDISPTKPNDQSTLNNINIALLKNEERQQIVANMLNQTQREAVKKYYSKRKYQNFEESQYIVDDDSECELPDLIRTINCSKASENFQKSVEFRATDTNQCTNGALQHGTNSNSYALNEVVTCMANSTQHQHDDSRLRNPILAHDSNNVKLLGLKKIDVKTIQIKPILNNTNMHLAQEVISMTKQELSGDAEVHFSAALQHSKNLSVNNNNAAAANSCENNGNNSINVASSNNSVQSQLNNNNSIQQQKHKKHESLNILESTCKTGGTSFNSTNVAVAAPVTQSRSLQANQRQRNCSFVSSASPEKERASAPPAQNTVETNVPVLNHEFKLPEIQKDKIKCNNLVMALDSRCQMNFFLNKTFKWETGRRKEIFKALTKIYKNYKV